MPEATNAEREAVDTLAGQSGQSYVRPEWGHIVDAFADRLADALGDDHDAVQDGDLWIDRYLAEHVQLARDARGFMNVPQYETVLLVRDLSAALVSDLGGEPASSNYVGGGFSADDAHERNVERLREMLDIPTEEADA